jgi:uncharacterized protein YpuA (DUF1002 family)
MTEQLKITENVIQQLVDLLLNSDKNTQEYTRIQNELKCASLHRSLILSRI